MGAEGSKSKSYPYKRLSEEKSNEYDEKLRRQNQSLWKTYSDLAEKNDYKLREQNKPASNQNNSNSVENSKNTDSNKNDSTNKNLIVL